MRRPRSKVIGAVDRDAAAFDLPLDLVFAEPVKPAGFPVDAQASGMRIEDVTVGIQPAGTRHDPFGANDARGGKEEGESRVDEHAKEYRLCTAESP